MSNYIKTTPFEDTYGFQARFVGFTGTATAGTTTDIDYHITAERWINGTRIILKDHAFGDTITFQVVDIDGLYSPAGTVLDQFGTNWNICSDEQDQDREIVAYPARIYPGLYIRVKYTSVGGTNVQVACNLYLHEKV